MVRKSAAFPVGLYAMLLFALAWLTLPALFAPVERWLVGAATVVPRLASLWSGHPAAAAERDDLARVDQLRSQLRRRVERREFAFDQQVAPPHVEQVLCGVLSASRRGGGGRMSELLLDHSYEELASCDRMVVKGEQLIGFLMEPGKGRAERDEPSDPARVMLCNHRDAPRLYAGVELGDAPLRFVVRPAAAADPAPMRADMWDDPYRAAQLDEVGLVVRTKSLMFGTGRETAPEGLVLGRARVWGYDDRATDDVLTIGVYVEPMFEPRALSHVVLWRPKGLPELSASGLREHTLASGVVYDLPGAHRGRHLLVSSGEVPDGAAVTQRGLLVGVARGLSFGNALVTSFPASRHRWSLLFLPDDVDQPVVEMSGVVERAEGGVAWVRWQGPPREVVRRLGDGFLFTGSNGRFCPSGLWIGRVNEHGFARDLIQVRAPVAPGPRAVDVLVGGEAAR
ncbi:MAG: hypothetical protein VYA51_09750 [Planctomycetota bacterium]|nr:hypothetical protein [Planctomycetota bacterium]MEC8653007.1 hypothetical protein [Planctomycetota bacterium]MEC9048285.1 hypothetical protein [Planctomycetota bacterium]